MNMTLFIALWLGSAAALFALAEFLYIRRSDIRKNDIRYMLTLEEYERASRAVESLLNELNIKVDQHEKEF